MDIKLLSWDGMVLLKWQGTLICIGKDYKISHLNLNFIKPAS